MSNNKKINTLDLVESEEKYPTYEYKGESEISKRIRAEYEISEAIKQKEAKTA